MSAAPNDKEQLVPSLAAVAPAAGPVAEVLIDRGFLSEAGSPVHQPPLFPSAASAVRAVETGGDGQPNGVRVLAALGRERHGRRGRDLEKKADPAEPAPEAPWAERMAHRVAPKAGCARYKLRQQTVEPIFGIIKAALGFRSFRLRSLAGAATEWTLVTLAYNLRRLHRLGADLSAA